jgi:hypothetical protein
MVCVPLVHNVGCGRGCRVSGGTPGWCPPMSPGNETPFRSKPGQCVMLCTHPKLSKTPGHCGSPHCLQHTAACLAIAQAEVVLSLAQDKGRAEGKRQGWWPGMERVEVGRARAPLHAALDTGCGSPEPVEDTQSYKSALGVAGYSCFTIVQDHRASAGKPLCRLQQELGLAQRTRRYRKHVCAAAVRSALLGSPGQWLPVCMHG